MTTQGVISVKGYVTGVPRSADPKQASVAIIQDDTEYRVIPRGAGVDLADNVGMTVEAKGTVEVFDEYTYMLVRGYRLLDDESWLDD